MLSQQSKASALCRTQQMLAARTSTCILRVGPRTYVRRLPRFRVVMGSEFNSDIFAQQHKPDDIKSLRFPPGKASEHAHVSSREQYDQMYKQSIEEPDVFWGQIAKDFFWKKPWEAPVRRCTPLICFLAWPGVRLLVVYDPCTPGLARTRLPGPPSLRSAHHRCRNVRPHIAAAHLHAMAPCRFNFDVREGPVKVEWFVGAETSITYNCLDRHVEAGHGDRVAFYWEGNDLQEQSVTTYAQLQQQACACQALPPRGHCSAMQHCQQWHAHTVGPKGSVGMGCDGLAGVPAGQLLEEHRRGPWQRSDHLHAHDPGAACCHGARPPLRPQCLI